jgi:hypothetical protein
MSIEDFWNKTPNEITSYLKEIWGVLDFQFIGNFCKNRKDNAYFSGSVIRLKYNTNAICYPFFENKDSWGGGHTN